MEPLILYLEQEVTEAEIELFAGFHFSQRSITKDMKNLKSNIV